MGRCLRARTQGFCIPLRGAVAIDEYHEWFVRTLGILGDPVAGRARIKAANAAQKKLKAMGRGIYGCLVRLQKTDLPAEGRNRMRTILAEMDSSLAFPQRREKP